MNPQERTANLNHTGWSRLLALALPAVAGALSLLAAGTPASAGDLSAQSPRPVEGRVIPVTDADGFLWLCREDEEGKQSICIPWPQPESTTPSKLVSPGK